MVKYIFSEGKVYADDGGFTPIPRRAAPHVGAMGLLVLLRRPSVPTLAGKEDLDVQSRGEEF